MLIQGPWPLRKNFQKCLKVIFLDVVFNNEKNDTGSGSLSPILPDLNESIREVLFMYSLSPKAKLSSIYMYILFDGEKFDHEFQVESEIELEKVMAKLCGKQKEPEQELRGSENMAEKS